MNYLCTVSACFGAKDHSSCECNVLCHNCARLIFCSLSQVQSISPLLDKHNAGQQTNLASTARVKISVRGVDCCVMFALEVKQLDLMAASFCHNCQKCQYSAELSDSDVYIALAHCDIRYKCKFPCRGASCFKTLTGGTLRTEITLSLLCSNGTGLDFLTNSQTFCIVCTSVRRES